MLLGHWQDDWQMLMTPLNLLLAILSTISLWWKGDRCVGLHHIRAMPDSAIQTYGFAKSSYLGQTEPPREFEYEVITYFHAR